MQLTCFVCNATGSIEAFSADAAASEFANLAGNLQPTLWLALRAYLGLFRTSRKLSFGKALKLAQEVVSLDADQGRLEIALTETVDALRAKGGKPLKNHNYLKRVLENTPATAAALSPEPRARSSKAAQAIAHLETWSNGEWLRVQIAMGLAAAVAQTLKHQPAAEMIALNADTWLLALKQKLTVEEIDAPRISAGFGLLLPTLTEWPQPRQLLEIMPPRPRREAIRHEPAVDMEQGLERFRSLRENLEAKP